MNAKLRSGLSLLALVLVVWGANEAWQGWVSDRLGRDVAALAQPGDIRMISSDTCVFCDRARTWFNANKVPFTECSIERDEDCAARFRALMSPGTPVLLVRGQPQLGFDADRVRAGLAART